MNRHVYRVTLAALCGVIAVGIGAWAVFARSTPLPTQSASSESDRTPWLVVEPGTEILFELSHAVNPRPKPRYFSDGSALLPPPPSPDGKYCPHKTHTRWAGTGIVWVTSTQLLYVAADKPEVVDGLDLFPHSALFMNGQRPAASLMIVTKGNPGLEAYGLTPEQAGSEYWWGKGSVRFRILSMRSREEAEAARDYENPWDGVIFYDR